MTKKPSGLVIVVDRHACLCEWIKKVQYILNKNLELRRDFLTFIASISTTEWKTV